MVALTIQSADDIVGAYLQTFGFSKTKAKEQAPVLRKQLKLDDAIGDNLVLHLNKHLAKKASDLFPDIKGTEEERAAFIKMAYLRANGSELWGIDFWLGKNKTMEDILIQKALIAIPSPCIGLMKPQPIEVPHASSFFMRIRQLFERKK